MRFYVGKQQPFTHRFIINGVTAKKNHQLDLKNMAAAELLTDLFYYGCVNTDKVDK